MSEDTTVNNEQPVAAEEIPPFANVEVTPEEIQAYFKSFIADKPFTATFQIFNGNASVTFRTIGVGENDDIQYHTAIEREKELLMNSDSFYTKVMNLRMAASISRIDDVPFLPELTRSTNPVSKDKLAESYLSKKFDVIAQWPAFKVVAFQNVFRDFELKVAKLTSEIKNKDFWKALAQS